MTAITFLDLFFDHGSPYKGAASFVHPRKAHDRRDGERYGRPRLRVSVRRFSDIRRTADARSETPSAPFASVRHSPGRQHRRADDPMLAQQPDIHLSVHESSFDGYIFKFFHALIDFYGIMKLVIYDSREENRIMANNMIIYTTADGLTKVETTFDRDTVWLTREQMATLFQRDRSVISRHIQKVFSEGELDEKSNVQKMHVPNSDKPVVFYNLDVIISVGYRVKSQRGVQFRIWASSILKEYLKKGFAMDDDRLKNLGGGGYFKELLERIRDIRASEKVFYRQVLEIYATSIDYDPNAAISVAFFKKVQNKIHYAVHGETAAETIMHRADAEKEFMGLTAFSGSQPTLQEARIAKNYLSEKEMRSMGQLVSGYLDFAERQAEREQPMTMADWSAHLDRILTMNGDPLLIGNGTVTHEEAMKKAETEYRKYKARTLSEVEQDYLNSICFLEERTKQNKPQ